MNMKKYLNRSEAGKILAQALREYANQDDIIVLALPRGGVPIGYEVAIGLTLPLDVFIVRKLGVPGHEELAMGAIASGGVVFLNEKIIRDLNIPKKMIDQVIQKETNEIKRREMEYRGHRPTPDFSQKIIILVDDGIATGATLRAAIKSLRNISVKQIIVAAPVGANDTCDDLATLVDKLICPLRPEYFEAVGQWYEDFDQTTDREVTFLMSKVKEK